MARSSANETSTKTKRRRAPAKKKPAKKKSAKKKPAKKKSAKKKSAKKKSAKKKSAKKKSAKKRVPKGTVDKWVGRLSRQHQRIVERLRKLIRAKAPDLDEAIKWSQPVYSGRQPICYIMARSNGHVTFGFWNGRQIADPSRVLEGTGGRMRHVKLRKPDDIPAAVLESLLEQAVAIDAQA
jgi:hypothetical protein